MLLFCIDYCIRAPFQCKDRLSRYGDSHVKDKTVARHGDPYYVMTTYLYWDTPGRNEYFICLILFISNVAITQLISNSLIENLVYPLCKRAALHGRQGARNHRHIDCLLNNHLRYRCPKPQSLHTNGNLWWVFNGDRWFPSQRFSGTAFPLHDVFRCLRWQGLWLAYVSKQFTTQSISPCVLFRYVTE